jgi:coenzyme F420 hydrogenase subunit beta
MGCGACAYICKNKCVQLRDVTDHGIRPIISADQCGTCTDCLQVCPGYSTPDFFISEPSQASQKLNEKSWGPIIEIWEGYASDSEIRYSGSSGGAATAIALYCLENNGMHGVLHIGSEEKNPLRNEVFLSRNRSDLISRTGSRYSPASPCYGLDKIESAPSSCVFIGKPCDVAGLQKARQLRFDLNDKVGLSIGIFCAGTPSSRGTLELLKKMKIGHDLIEDVRYRGRGWPGMFTVDLNDSKDSLQKMPYMEAWGFLQKYRPYRCYLCPDGTAAHADISCGDPWYRSPQEGDAGYSLVIARTEKGKKVLHNAINAGYLSLTRVDIQKLIDSQDGLLQKIKDIWGRLLMMKIFGLPVPQYPGFFLFEQWFSLSINRKIRTLMGTARRIVQRKYYLPFVSNAD